MMSEKIFTEIVQRLLLGENLSIRQVEKEYGITRWKASQLLSVAKYETKKLTLQFSFTPDKPKNFLTEKQTYRYLQETLFDIAYKVYSPVLKGLPDFIVVSTKRKELEPGFYEVKLKGRKLSKHQEKLMAILGLGFNVYLVEVSTAGEIEVYKWR